MAFWFVLIEGRLPPNGPIEAKGFIAARYVRARDSADAEQAAKAMIMKDWLDNYVQHPRHLPQLMVEEVQQASWWSWFRWHNRGHTFYEQD